MAIDKGATLSCPGIIKAAIKAAIKAVHGVAAVIRVVPGVVAPVASLTGKTHLILTKFLKIFEMALVAVYLAGESLLV
jgi:hypothetical protein